MPSVPEFTDSELHHIREMLTQRYGKDVEIEMADCEFMVDRNSQQPARCPTVLWYEKGVNFVIFKVDEFRYRALFFYTPHDQYKVGTEDYHELDECISAVLQGRSDHEHELKGMHPGDNSNNPT